MTLIPMPVAIHDQQSCIVPYFDHPCLRNSVVISDAIGIMWHWCWCNGITWTKNYFAYYFDHLDVRNSLLLFTMPFALCAANASTNYITGPKQLCSTSFQSSWPKEWISAIDNVICIMWCWWCHMTQSHTVLILIILLDCLNKVTLRSQTSFHSHHTVATSSGPRENGSIPFFDTKVTPGP